MSEIKMDYGLMEEQNKLFLQGVEQLQDTNQAMQNIANMLEEGALLGDGGVAFTEAIRGKLCPAIARLTEKYTELAQDIMQAMSDMRDADTSTERMY